MHKNTILDKDNLLMIVDEIASCRNNEELYINTIIPIVFNSNLSSKDVFEYMINNKQSVLVLHADKRITMKNIAMLLLLQEKIK